MFEQRVVAFLDILGFKNLVTRAERDRSALQQLIMLKNLIDHHVDYDNLNLDKNVPPHIHPKYLFVSDSIILSAPLPAWRIRWPGCHRC